MRSFGRDGDPALDDRSEILTIDHDLYGVCPDDRGGLRTRRGSHTEIRHLATR